MTFEEKETAKRELIGILIPRLVERERHRSTEEEKARLDGLLNILDEWAPGARWLYGSEAFLDCVGDMLTEEELKPKFALRRQWGIQEDEEERGLLQWARAGMSSPQFLEVVPSEPGLPPSLRQVEGDGADGFPAHWGSKR